MPHHLLSPNYVTFLLILPPKTLRQQWEMCANGLNQSSKRWDRYQQELDLSNCENMT